MSRFLMPLNLHLILIFFHVCEIFLPLASAAIFLVWFSVADVTADGVHGATLQSSGVCHQKVHLHFYAALLFIFFIFSAGVGFVYYKWKTDSSTLNRARLQGTYIFHPICWHLLKLRQNEMKNERIESNSKQCSWSTGNDEKPKTEHCRMSHPIPILHALLLSQPCLLLQLYIRSINCMGKNSPYFPTSSLSDYPSSTGASNFFYLSSLPTSSSSSSFSSSFPSSPTSFFIWSASDFQLVVIFFHVISYISSVSFFINEIWKQTEAQMTADAGDNDLCVEAVIQHNYNDTNNSKNNNNKFNNSHSNNHINDSKSHSERFFSLFLFRLLLLISWSILVILTLANVLQLFVRGRIVAGILSSLNYNALFVPLLLYQRSCLQSPWLSFIILSLVIAYVFLSNTYLWFIFNEINTE